MEETVLTGLAEANPGDHNQKIDFRFNPVTNSGYAWLTQFDGDKKSGKTLTDRLEKYAIPQPKFTQAYNNLLLHVVDVVENCTTSSDLPDKQPPDALVQEYMAQLDLAISSEKEAQICEENVFKFQAALIVVECLAFMYFRNPDREILSTDRDDSPYSLTASIKTWASHLEPGMEEEVITEIMKLTNPETHPMFWTALIDQAVRGNFDVLERMVSESVLQDTSSIEDANVKHFMEIFVQLCQSYPESDNLYEFKQWRDSCKNCVDQIIELKTGSNHGGDADSGNANGRISPDVKRHLLTLFSLFAGDEQTIFDVSDSWCTILAALYIYGEPHPERIREYYNKAVRQKPVDRTLVCHECCSDIMEDRLLHTLRALENLDVGVAATVGVLCHAQGLFFDYTDRAGDLVDWLVVELASACIGSDGGYYKYNIGNQETNDGDTSMDTTLYKRSFGDAIARSGTGKLTIEKLGVDLLILVNSEQSVEMVGEILPRLNVDPVLDPHFFEWVVDQCRILRLTAAELAIYKCAANKYVAHERYLEAFVALSKIKDADSMASLSWKLFENTLASGSLPSDNEMARTVLSDPDTAMPEDVREALSPFAVLAGFLTNLEKGDLRSAAQFLIALVQFRHLPSKYLGVLLYLLRPFISDQRQQLLSCEDLTLIMTAVNDWDEQVDEDLLQHVVSNSKWGPWLDRCQDHKETDHLARKTRILLAHEMARALVRVI